MQSESKSQLELLERYEKSFGEEGRKRKLIVLGIAGFALILVVAGFMRSMSYIGGLSTHVYDAFEESSASSVKSRP